MAPITKFHWDVVVQAEELKQGRDPKLFYKYSKEFFEKAKKENKPFFLMANSQDPHRPFAGSEQEKAQVEKGKKVFPTASKYYKPEEIEVPGFLPDLPDIRTELAQYYTCVHRCDETVGEVLRALKETGFEKNTLVMFLSDNGISVPYAKTNCYLNSTKTPWIVKWPEKVKPGTVDTEHFISGIDYMPTILEACGLPQVEKVDGKSFAPVLLGQKQPDRVDVFTVFSRTSGRNDYPMRAIQDKKYGYIFNPWSDGKIVFRNEPQSGLTFNAMKEAGKTDPKIDSRVKLFIYRVPEELYDYETDPDGLNNLVNDEKFKDVAKQMRERLLTKMESITDPLAPVFKDFLEKGSVSPESMNNYLEQYGAKEKKGKKKVEDE